MSGLNLRAEGAPHAVVIGSGFGGLAAAVRLGAKGYRVTVVEKLDGPGGRAYTFRQDGFTFDAGPTILTAPHLFEELWALCGRRLEDEIKLESIDPFYRIRFDDGSVFVILRIAYIIRSYTNRWASAAHLPGLGHLAHEEDAARVAAAIYEALGAGIIPVRRSGT